MINTLDTSAIDPGAIISLRDAQVKNTLENQKIQAGDLSNANAQNLYATQVLTGAVASGQQSIYDNARQHLADMGVDVSNLAPDIQTGTAQVTAARQAQYNANPLNTLLGLGMKGESNIAQAAGVTGNTNTAAQLDPTSAAVAAAANARLTGQPIAPGTPAPRTVVAPPIGSASPTPAPSAAPQALPTPQPVGDLPPIAGGTNPGMDMRADSLGLGGGNVSSAPQPVSQAPAAAPGASTTATPAGNTALSTPAAQSNPLADYQKTAGAPVTATGATLLDANGSTATKFVPPSPVPGDIASVTQNKIDNAFKAWQQNPAVQNAQAQATSTGKTAGEDIGAQPAKTAAAKELFGRISQNLDAMDLENNTGNVPSDKNFIPASTRAAVSQNLGNWPGGDGQVAANAYNAFSKVDKAQILNGIQDLVQSGSIRNSQALINLVGAVNSIDPGASQQSRTQQIAAVRSELKNLATSEANVGSDLTGGATTPYAPIPMTPQAAALANKPAASAGGWSYGGVVKK